MSITDDDDAIVERAYQIIRRRTEECVAGLQEWAAELEAAQEPNT